MKTAHISLDDETYELLRQESRTRKVPISSVIRESIIQRTEAKIRETLEACHAAFGLWQDRTFDVDSHIRELRKDRNVC